MRSVRTSQALVAAGFVCCAVGVAGTAIASSARNAIIEAEVISCGGPGRHQICDAPPSVVTVTNQQGKLVASAHTGPHDHGIARFHVVPGTYMVSAHGFSHTCVARAHHVAVVTNLAIPSP